ncbi:MAG: hypothetical protein R3E11_12845 [Sphingobium sp.]|nr:hypothetical protein [Sphingobium sp.]MCP5399285.1 hypothetical protein [Sphingomonas sp.]
MRISDRTALVLLAGSLSACGSALEGEPVSCRVGEEEAFAETCLLVWQGQHDFIIHHPDGGFRRFIVARDTREIHVADGAEMLEVKRPEKGLLSLTIGDTVYRIEERQFQR